MSYEFISHKNDQDYQMALSLFWKEKYNQTLDLIFFQVSQPEEDIGRWYRLWIGVLAEKKNLKGLESLYHHLCTCENDIYNHSVLFKDLKNMTLWELGDFESIITKKFSKYLISEELRQKISWSQCKDLKDSYIEKKIHKDFLDYFFIKTDLQALLVSGKTQKIDDALRSMKKFFPNSPDQNLYPMFRHIDQDEHNKALPYAESLIDLYPTEYHAFLSGYLASKCKNYDRTIQILEPFKDRTQDPDLLTTLAYAYGQIGEKNKSLQIYKKAKQKRQALGLPTLDLDDSIVFLDGNKTSKKEKKFWFIFLNSRNSEELFQSSEDSLEYLHRPVSKEMLRGDDVFLVRKSSLKTSKVQILAWYTVESSHSYDSLKGFCASLKLESLIPERMYVSGKVLEKKTDHPTESIFEVSNKTSFLIKKKIILSREESHEEHFVKTA